MAAESFGEYPMFDLVFRAYFSKRRNYLRYMEKLHRVNLRTLAKRNKCFVGVLDGKIVSAALLQNPEIPKITMMDYIRSGALGLLWPVGTKGLAGFFDISEFARKTCEDAYPESWYLELLVIDGAHKGQGLGSGMLNDCIKPYVYSQGGHRITLITNSEGNCKFYERNGFVPFAKTELNWNGKTADNWSYSYKLSQ